MRGPRSAIAIAVVLLQLSNVGLVHAAGEPYSATYSESDRVRRVEYKDDLVLQVVGYADHPMLLELDPGEPILGIAGGKVSNWEVEFKGSRLFVRPLESARNTTVLVASKSRTYILDLAPGVSKARPSAFVSKIVVTYPTIQAPVVEKVVDPVAEAKAELEATSPLDAAQQAARNRRYSLEVVSEGQDIRPREVFDDGRFTYFKFPDNLPIPTIYKSAPGAKDEWLVNSHRDGDFIVVHGIAPLWNLRLSESVIGVFNDAFEPAGLAPSGDMTIAGFKREVRK
ncbi:TrbG/VirB9 family P-type conjugative transfer protein [Variovorax paradoxus]|uniref:TrbG/VirB9 family P-type conjugative transfer protein n=1 Tax=Variovorax paradoxus TaxID=34073 RepID=UPI0024789268